MDLYHVLNRGVEGREIFLSTGDYARFVHDLYEFNDAALAENTRRKLSMTGLRNPSLGVGRVPIVKIHGWCLMKNHYHLLLSEEKEGGISTFLRKLNVGYANYFNVKYGRSGYLFQGRTKKKHIDSDAYFLHILNYIHLNPLDYLRGNKDWRERKIDDSDTALRYLEGYRWSSYLDYAGKKNFPSILTKNLFESALGDVAKTTKKYLRALDIHVLGDLALE